MTSTCVERIFKDLTSWTAREQQSLQMIGAKHVNSVYAKTVDRWRAGLSEHERRKQSGKERPPWVKHSTPGARMTGFHLFTREKGFSKAQVFGGAARLAWRELEEEMRDEYTDKAQHRRNVATARPSPLETYEEELREEDPLAGPFGLSSARGVFTMHPAVVEATLAKKQ